jgi:hypothetical protein
MEDDGGITKEVIEKARIFVATIGDQTCDEFLLNETDVKNFVIDGIPYKCTNNIMRATVYTPKFAIYKNPLDKPAIVFFHGGGFIAGTRSLLLTPPFPCWVCACACISVVCRQSTICFIYALRDFKRDSRQLRNDSTTMLR